jgi:hypothetical protein
VVIATVSSVIMINTSIIWVIFVITGVIMVIMIKTSSIRVE